MPWPRTRELCLAALVSLCGCGVRKGAPEWIPKQAAVVACTAAGRHLELPPLLREIPHPQPASGLYSRGIDPIALFDLGFASDRPACAVLIPEPHTVEDVLEARDSLTAVRRAWESADKNAGELGSCACEVARAEGRRELLRQCERTSTKRGCEVTAAQRGRLRTILEPLEQAIEGATVPRVHWRLVGITDRPGWFGEHLPTILPRHPGGSDVYLKGSPVPEQLNSELVTHLLGRDDVTVVVRQDSGRSLLVVREVGKSLILDHFAYPTVGPEIQPLVGPLDNAGIEAFDEALEKPSSSRSVQFNPRKGSILELDEGLLSLVDDGVEAATALDSRPYLGADETWDRPPPLLSRISLSIPYGKEGEVVEFHGTYTAQGATMASGLGDEPISVTLDEFAVSSEPPTFELAGEDPGFVFRGQPIQTILFDGLHRLPWLLATIERNRPSTVEGSSKELEVSFPSGPLPGEMETAPGLGPLRERLSKRRHRLTIEFGANTLQGELAPN